MKVAIRALQTRCRRVRSGLANPDDAIPDPSDFAPFTYSRRSHCERFAHNGLERRLYGTSRNLSDWRLKRYQDLLTLSFIESWVPEGARLLEVGGGDSRIIRFLKGRYELWNADKLEGLGCGPRQVKEIGFKLVRAYLGDFSPQLADSSFDFVFSISALEHIPQSDPGLLPRIHADLNRVLKPGGYSLHCLDVVLCPDHIRMNKLLPYLFTHQETCNPFVAFELIRRDSDLFVLPESVYIRNWQPRTGQSYADFGMPFSYNILWRKT
ncbi:MAG: class I SAM-dependent methyltransferase [Acidobacteriota bacterium]